MTQDGLFVYGTLLTGEAQEGLLAGLERQQAWVRGSLYSLPQGYPGLSLDGTQRVWGELVAGVSMRHLSMLDLYEGVGQGLYRREQITVTVGLRTMGAWAYVHPAPDRAGGRLLPSGRWTAIRRR